MGRAHNQSSASSSGGFDQVFGARRGTDPAQAHAALLARMQAGDLDNVWAWLTAATQTQRDSDLTDTVTDMVTDQLMREHLGLQSSAGPEHDTTRMLRSTAGYTVADVQTMLRPQTLKFVRESARLTPDKTTLSLRGDMHLQAPGWLLSMYVAGCSENSPAAMRRLLGPDFETVAADLGWEEPSELFGATPQQQENGWEELLSKLPGVVPGRSNEIWSSDEAARRAARLHLEILMDRYHAKELAVEQERELYEETGIQLDDALESIERYADEIEASLDTKMQKMVSPEPKRSRN